MWKVILKFIGGILIGSILFSFISVEQAAGFSEWILFNLWGVGIVGGFREYLTWLSAGLDSSLKLGILTWISFGSGVIGLVLFVLILGFVLTIGWVYGWVRLLRELIAVV